MGRLEGWDRIQRFMDDVHGQQRDQEEVVLEIGKEIAMCFIPATWFEKLRYLKYIGRIFKWKRGAAATEKAVAETVEATGSYYSVGFEMKLSKDLYPGGSYRAHFQAANKALDDAIVSDVTFANSMKELGVSIPKTKAGNIIGKSPENWVWHHDVKEGVMQLVSKTQHPSAPGGIFWETMHPGGKGGMSIWNK